MTRDALEHNQIPVYFAAVLLAVVFGLLAPSFAHGLSALVTPAIAALMYAMFLQIPFLDLRQGLGHKRFLSALLLANFILVPLLVWALTQSLAGHPALLVGALLVLLTPCIDYVVVFTHIGKGDSRLMLAATPVLLLLQLALLPLYLSLMLGAQSEVVVQAQPFVEAFLLLIVVPMILAVVTTSLARRSSMVSDWSSAWAWLPVPAMALVLFVVIASHITSVVRDMSLLYPFAVHFGMAHFAPWQFALLLGGLWLARVLTGERRPGSLWIAGVALVFCALLALFNSPALLRWYPVLISSLMLSLFGLSLKFGPPMVERLARLREPELPDSAIRYTRQVTRVWCLFFMLNGLIAASLTLWAPLSWWTLYNGLIAYGLDNALCSC